MLLQVNARHIVPRRGKALGSLSTAPTPAPSTSQLRRQLSERLVAQADAEEVPASPSSQLRQELAHRLATHFGQVTSADEESLPVNAPKKSKVTLMVLEILPPCGQLGIDRLYLGSTKTGIAKLLVCVCTCLVGGLVWGLVDAIIVIANCLGRDKYIDTLGMSAAFTEDEVETAHALAVIGVAIQFMTCCAAPSALSCLRRFVYTDKKTGLPVTDPTVQIPSRPSEDVPAIANIR